jgi:hypothetical protein
VTTKFYFHDAATTNTGTLPSGEQSASAPSVTAAGGTAQRSMDGTAGAKQVSATLTSLANTSAQPSLFRMFQSAPLQAQTIGAGTWQLSMAASEANTNANMNLCMCLYVWRPSTGAIVGTRIVDSPSTNTGNVTEPGTSQTAVTDTSISGGSVTVQNGDILVCEIWHDSTVQGNATARVETFYYDGTTEASTSNCASFLLAPADIPVNTVTSPIFVTDYDNTDWTSNTTPKTQSVTTAAGDVLAIPGQTDDNLTVLDAPTGTLSYNLEDSVVVTDYNWTGIWSAIDSTGHSFTFSQTRSGSGTERWGNDVLRFRNSGGIGAHAKNNSTSGGPSVSLTTTQDNSAVVVIAGDWNGVDGTSRVWRTVNSFIPTADNGCERHYDKDIAPDTRYLAYYPNVGVAGAKTFGLSTPSSGMHWSIIAVEIKGPISGTGSVGMKKPSLQGSRTQTLVGMSLDVGGASSAPDTSQATATVTPSKNAFLVLWVCYAVTGGTTITSVSDTFSGTSAWTKQTSVTISSSTKIDCWTAKAGSSPGSGAVTMNFGVACSRSYDLDQVASDSALKNIITANTKTATATTTTDASVSFGTAVDTNGLFLIGTGAAASITQTPSESPVWRELADTSHATPSCSLETQISPDVSHTSGSSTPGGSSNRGIIGIEVSLVLVGTGSVAMKKPGLSGSGTVSGGGVTGTGSVAIKKPSLSGAGTPKYIATGSVGMKKPSLSGAGTPRYLFTGSVALKKPSLSASATEKISGTGSVSVHKPSLSAAGTPKYIGTGSVSVHKPSLSGSGTPKYPFTGSVSLKKPSLSASATEKISGTGSVSLKKPALAGSNINVTGTGSVALKKPSLQGTGGWTINNSAEGGTNGTTVTTGNSGGASRVAFNAITIGSLATLTFDNTHAMHGGLSYKFVTGSPTANSIVQWTTSLTGSSLTQVWFRAYVYITGNPGATLRCIRALSGGTLRAVVGINTAGKIVCLDAGGTARSTAASALPTNQWVRIEGYFIGDAATGQVEAKYWTNADSVGTPTETLTTASNLNTGGTLNRVDFGDPSSATSYTHWMDDFGASPFRYIGPLNGSTGSVALKKPSLSASGTEKISGTGSVSLKKPSLSASATEKISGTGSVSLHKPSLSGSGGIVQAIGTGSVNVHKPSLSASGSERESGTGSVSLKKPSLSASATEKISGTGSVSLKKPSLSASGTAKILGTGSINVHKLSLSASGTERESGTGSVSTHKMSLSGSGTARILGTGSVNTHKMSLSSSGFVHASGSGSVSMHKPALSVAGYEQETGTGSVAIHKPALHATGGSGRKASPLFVFTPV